MTRVTEHTVRFAAENQLFEEERIKVQRMEEQRMNEQRIFEEQLMEKHRIKEQLTGELERRLRNSGTRTFRTVQEFLQTYPPSPGVRAAAKSGDLEGLRTR